jgi:hypothetical protein
LLAELALLDSAVTASKTNNRELECIWTLLQDFEIVSSSTASQNQFGRAEPIRGHTNWTVFGSIKAR